MTLEEQCNSTHSREDFVAFVGALHRDLRENPSAWGNVDLQRYLEALAAWVKDMDGYYRNNGEVAPDQPDWKLAANMLLAAKMYE
jgi:hypothetical protein